MFLVLLISYFVAPVSTFSFMMVHFFVVSSMILITKMFTVSQPALQA